MMLPLLSVRSDQRQGCWILCENEKMAEELRQKSRRLIFGGGDRSPPDTFIPTQLLYDDSGGRATKWRGYLCALVSPINPSALPTTTQNPPTPNALSEDESSLHSTQLCGGLIHLNNKSEANNHNLLLSLYGACEEKSKRRNS